MKKINQFFLRVYAHTSTIALFWLIVFLVLLTGKMVLTWDINISTMIIIVGASAWILFDHYHAIATEVKNTEYHVAQMERLLKQPKMESIALSLLWEICMNESGKFDNFFNSQIIADRFHERFLNLLNKLTQADMLQYKGVRSLDFAEALSSVLVDLEEMENSDKRYFHVVMLERLRVVHKQVIENFVKPQEAFFAEHSDVKSYSKYVNSLQFRYDTEVLDRETVQWKINTYFKVMTSEQILALMVAVVTDDNFPEEFSDDLRVKHIKGWATGVG